MKRLIVLFTPLPLFLHSLRFTYPPHNPIHKHADITQTRGLSRENCMRRTQPGYV